MMVLLQMELRMERECINIRMEIVLEECGKMIKSLWGDIHIMKGVCLRVISKIMPFTMARWFIWMEIHMRANLSMAKGMELESTRCQTKELSKVSGDQIHIAWSDIVLISFFFRSNRWVNKKYLNFDNLKF